ncbi:MAG: asparagine synthase (glutamine-hydrolyzing) [Lachnospiraceae bacterium]|nr:asparagine synthase (glutamine-hydrolyzing) [Lachnospiraceae bacterium]
MCGIAGYISKKDNAAIPQYVSQMLDTIRHRGPDGSGIRIFRNRVGLGHRRLAILDLSENGLQPMQMGNRWITFNGEIYNYLEIRRDLIDCGYSFKTDTDTEVILAAYDKWGKTCVEHFNGMWAFAIYDDEKQSLFCSRDRFGVKPFYYQKVKNSLIFGSEIKEILAVQQGEVKANIDRLKAFLAAGIVEADESTFFSDIFQLPGGCNLIFDCLDFGLTIEKYYDLRDVNLNKYAAEENYQRFRDAFFQSVRFRLRADVPVGSCLSGGLDSSAIVCAAHEILKEQQNEGRCTVSSCFDDKRYDEREYIDAVVRHTGVTPYQVFPDMDHVFDELDDIIWHMDEPFGGTSIYAQWCVFREAKQHGLTVMLDGQGADEQLAGYTPFYKVLFIQLLKGGKFKQLRHEIQCFKELRAGTEDVNIRDTMLSTVTSLLLPDSVRYSLNRIYRRKQSGLPYDASFYDNKYLKAGYRLYNKRRPQQYIFASMTNGMQSLLHYEDRDSMAFSIESRVPFLDKDLAEFIYSVPIEQKIRDGKTKNVLREGLKDVLPEEIYNRYSKLGFVTPEDQWLRDNQDFFRAEIEKSCNRLSSLVDKERVLHWYDTHVDKTRMGDNTCFRLICAAHWTEVFGVEI